MYRNIESCFIKKLLYIIRTAQNVKFSFKDFFSKCEQILNGKIHFCALLYLVEYLQKSLLNIKTNRCTYN